MPPRKKTETLAPETELETLRHPADVTRRNIPTAETSSLMIGAENAAPPLLYPRNPDLDPQLVWRGKDALDAVALSVPTVPIYIQEKLLPEALIRDLRRVAAGSEPQADLFGGFDRIADPETKLEFYEHAENWSNRMILGDSLLVMNSLAEKEATARPGADDLPGSALRDLFRQQLAAEHAVARREGGQGGGAKPRAGADQGVPRYVEGRGAYVPVVFARSAGGGAGVAGGERKYFRSDWG